MTQTTTRIDPRVAKSLQNYLFVYFGEEQWGVKNRDNDTHPHLIATKRITDIAHAYQRGYLDAKEGNV